MVKRILSFLLLLSLAVAAWAQSAAPVPVTVDNLGLTYLRLCVRG